MHSTDNGVNFIQNNSYAYNERGWMSKITDLNITAKTVFGMDFTYANKPDAFNGNIGSASWQTKVPEGWNLTQEIQNYIYDYDKLNRLKTTAYSTPSVVDKFNEELSYDVMDNITSLKRKNAAASGFLNDLSYNYTNGGITGNKLWGVADVGSAAQSSNYDYDLNGNQYTGSQLGAIKRANQYKLAGKAVIGVSVAIGIAETFDGYQTDGGKFGYNFQSALAQNGGSLAGGWAGAEAGAAVGAAFGVWFGGVGAIPGAVIGGVVGGFVGGYYGGQAGGNIGQGVVNYYHGR